MSNRPNRRRQESRRTEHGPRWESPNPGNGCNATHVARSRRKWKRVKNRTERRTGRVSPKVGAMRSGTGKFAPRPSTEES